MMLGKRENVDEDEDYSDALSMMFKEEEEEAFVDANDDYSDALSMMFKE